MNRGNSFRPQCIWDPYLERPSRVFPFLLFSFSLAYLRALRKNALTDPECPHWPKLGSNSILFGLRTARWLIGQRSHQPLMGTRERSDLHGILVNIICVFWLLLFSFNQYNSFKQAIFIFDLKNEFNKEKCGRFAILKYQKFLHKIAIEILFCIALVWSSKIHFDILLKCKINK